MDSNFRMQHTQHTATPCNTLQHPATPDNTLHHTATRNTQWSLTSVCNTLSTLQHPTTPCNTQQYIASHCNSQHAMDSNFRTPRDAAWETRRWPKGVRAVLSTMYIQMCIYIFRCIYEKVLYERVLCIHMYKYMLRNSSMGERSVCYVEQDVYSDVYICIQMYIWEGIMCIHMY